MAVHVMEERENTKASLKAWWSAFTKVKIPAKEKKSPVEENRVFGIPLRKSLKYASVAISMAGDDGNQYVWGYVPVIVAKVGLYLKENAVETEGVFRIAGSQKRMRELQETFDLPPRYGKDVDWSKYSIHDAASVLRRYLNQMPEPIIPLHLYNEFRNIMMKKPFDSQAAIKTYRLLITSSPPANQYLLLYVLDLLAVFARASDKNLMPASNLAVIFQPGMFSHPSHLSSANEHKIAVQVLEFLIEHQDHFVLGLSHPPPANVSPADLTVVSQPIRDDEVYFEPSDSDEDLGQLEAHQGGGAKLVARRSVSGQRSVSPSGGPGKKRLFGKRNAVGGVEMQPSASMNALSTSDNERVNNQVIGSSSGGGGATTGATTAVRYAPGTSLTDASASNGPTTLSNSPSGSKIKRSKTTPTRRTASGRVLDAKADDDHDDEDDAGPATSSSYDNGVSRRKARRSSGGGGGGDGGGDADDDAPTQQPKRHSHVPTAATATTADASTPRMATPTTPQGDQGDET